MAAGYPIVTLVDLTDVWVTFQVREDRLAGLKMGGRSRSASRRSATGELELTVFYVAPPATSRRGGPRAPRAGST